MSAELQPIELVCGECKHEWEEPIIVNVPLRVVSAHMLSVRCPACDAPAKKLAFRISPEDAGIRSLIL